MWLLQGVVPLSKGHPRGQLNLLKGTVWIVRNDQLRVLPGIAELCPVRPLTAACGGGGEHDQ